MLNATARNLKLEDIENVTEYSATMNNDYRSIYGKEETVVGMWPEVWYNEEKGSFERIERNKSIAYPLTTKNVISTTNSSETIWANNIDGMLKYETDTYQDMLENMEKSNHDYWLSTRTVGGYLDSNEKYVENVYFAIYEFVRTGIGGKKLYDIYGRESQQTFYIRPLVMIPKSSYELTKSSIAGMDYEIKAK